MTTMLNTQLLAFLEQKPATETYNYMDCWKCAAAQFNESISRIYTPMNSVEDRETKATFDGRLESIAHEQPWNFGAMLERAKKEFA